MIKLENVTKSYQAKNRKIDALQNINLEIKKGEFVVIRGPSGSGKTTLLLAIGGMLRPSAGKIWVEGAEIYALNQSDRNHFRAQNVGFVFQMFHLLPYLNVLENILLPAAGRNARTEAMALLQKMGLTHREKHEPAALSAGERQRTAIARALVNHPKIILADEPTGNLDPENAEVIIRHLADFQQTGGTVIVVTHGTAAERFANRIFRLKNGKLAD